MKNLLIILLVGFMVTGPTGCSLFVPWNQTLTVTTSENGADIYVNGELKGTGRIETRVRRNRNVGILVKKEGFKPTSRQIGYTFSTTGILDLVGGCLILLPFLGLISPGSQCLMESNVVLVLVPEKS